MSGRRTALTLALVLIGLQRNVKSAQAAEPTDPPNENAEVASDVSVRERAKQLYDEGVAAYRDGKHSEAIDKLLEADRVMPNAAFSYNIAVVYEAMGDQRSALRWLRSYLRQSKPGSENSAILDKVRKFEAQLQARGLQQVSVLSAPAGATLKVDGVALGITPFTTELPPGSHVAYLSMEGFEPAQRAFELRSDRSMDLEVALTPAKPAEPAAEPGVTAAPASDAKSVVVPPPTFAPVAAKPVDPEPAALPPARRVNSWTWISLGVGTALFGGAMGFELKRRSDEDAARHASQADYLHEYDRMQTSQTAARVLVVAGSIVFATGVGLLTFDLTRSRPVRAVSIGTCASGGLCTGLEGQF